MEEPSAGVTEEQAEIVRLRARVAALEAERAGSAPAGNPGGPPLTPDGWHSSRDQLDLILDAVADGITVTTAEGMLYANPAAARALQLGSVAELLATPLAAVFAPFELLDEQGRPFPPDRLPGRRALAGEERPSMVMRFRARRGGEDQWALVTASPLRDTAGHVWAAVNIFHDLTDHRRSEEAIQRHEEQLRLAVEAVHLGTWEWDLAARRIRWPPTTEALFGLAPGTFDGSYAGFLTTIHPADRPRIEATITHAVATAAPLDAEYRVIWPDASLHWIAVRGRFVAEGGRSGRMLGIALDVTARRGQEEAQRFLNEASDILASSLDYEVTLARVAHLAVAWLADWTYVDMVEADGSIRRVAVVHADLRYAERAREVLAYPPDPQSRHPVAQALATGQPVIQLDIQPEELVQTTRNAAHLALALELGLRSTLTVPLIARERTLGAITFLSAAPHRYGATELALAMDLARRAALAVDNARLYREAQEAVRARDEFLSVAAHELRTPLTSLRGYTQLLVRQIQRGDRPDLQRLTEVLHTIDQQSAKVTALVSQLLDISRIDAGRLDLAAAPVDVVTLVRDVAAGSRITLLDHPLVVPGGEAIPAMLDPLRLEQVLINLIDNARKHSPPGAPIELTVAAPDAATVEIAVRDHGAGVPPERRERLFDRFYQAPGAGTLGGLGLGLFISREIVEQHGGQIRAEFPDDGGARFVVRLPRVRAPAAGVREARPAHSAHGRVG